jgi:hypothetical protein
MTGKIGIKSHSKTGRSAIFHFQQTASTMKVFKSQIFYAVEPWYCNSGLLMVLPQHPTILSVTVVQIFANRLKKNLPCTWSDCPCLHFLKDSDLGTCTSQKCPECWLVLRWSVQPHKCIYGFDWLSSLDVDGATYSICCPWPMDNQAGFNLSEAVDSHPTSVHMVGCNIQSHPNNSKWGNFVQSRLDLWGTPHKWPITPQVTIVHLNHPSSACMGERTDGRTDGRTDRRTDRHAPLQYLGHFMEMAECKNLFP